MAYGNGLVNGILRGDEMADILIVEDNVEMGELLCNFLQNEVYYAILKTTGEDAVKYYEHEGAKLVILDITLPNMDGFSVCSKIRENGNTPIIIVSARGSKEDMLNGLMLGADDYIEKPYDIDILIAKIKGIFVRRYSTDVIIDGNIKLDKVKRTLYKDDIEISLTQKEYELLLILMENPRKTFSKEVLFNKVWGFDSFSEQQTITVHIKWLRYKIEVDEKIPKKIVTVWGVGYRYE